MNQSPRSAASRPRPTHLSFFLSALYLFAFLLILLPAARAQDNASFVSQNVPTAMVAGQQYSVSVTMQNTGTTTWTDGNGYHLGSANPRDNTTWATTQGNGQRVVQPLNVPPGGKATFAFVVTAPSPATQTSYNFQWQMVRDGVAWFGTNSNNVVVTVSAQAGQATRPQVMAGGSNSFGATSAAQLDSAGEWEVYNGSGARVGSSAAGGANGWSITCTTGGQFTVAAPAGAVVGQGYTASCATAKNRSGSGENIYFAGYTTTFDVIAGPVTAGIPGPTGTPYPWQTAVGGVNTANGNKMFTLPLTGWTARGGLAVGMALTFNSQNAFGGGSGGHKWTATYDTFINGASSTDATITWGDGRRYTFHRNSDGTYTPPAGIYDTLTYNAAVSSFDLKTKGQTVYHFFNGGSNTHYPNSIVDENGNTITFTRSGYGNRVSAVTDPTGRVLTLTYDGSGRLNFVRNEQSAQFWTLHYDGSGNLTQVNWPALGGVTPNLALAYDGNQNLTSFTDLKGTVAWSAVYDAASRLTSESDACSNGTGFDYTHGTTVTDPNNNATVYNYAGTLLASMTDATGKTETYTYDLSNNLTKMVDRRGKVWTYGVDTKHGNATRSTDPVGNTGSAVYDARNSKTLQTTDALNETTTFVYDSAGVNLISTTDPLGHTSTVNAYSYGLPTSVSDALGHTSTMAYDAYGDLILSTDANGNRAGAFYNVAGWKLSSYDALGNLSTFVYDAWGRVVSATDPNRTTVSTGYDNNGNALQVTLRHAYALKCGGGALGPFADDSALHGDTTGGSSGVLTSTDQPDLSSIQAYNPATGSVYQSARQGDFNYYLGGFTPGRTYTVRLHVCDMWDSYSGQRSYDVQINGQTVLGSFDPTGTYGFRKAVILEFSANADSSGHIDAYFYNRYGGALVNAVEVVPVSADRTLATGTYDADNRPLTMTRGNGDTVTYQYDDATRRGQLVYKTDGNGNTLGYAYTVRGEPSQIGYPDGTNEFFGYDENGDLLTHTKQEGSVIHYAYDDDSRLTTTTYPSAAINPTVTVGYDAAGRQTTMTDGLGTTNWSYDAGGRLTALGSGQEAMSYAYDDADRLTSKVLASVGTWTYQYDAGGRVTAQGTPQGAVTYAYDAANRLSRLTKGNGMLTDYAYDPDGRATEVFWHWNWSSAVMGDYHYRYDPVGDLLERSDPTDGSDTTYSYDGADQLASESSNGYSWYGTPGSLTQYTYDRNGNRLSKSVTTGAGTLTDTYTYQASHYNAQVHTDRLASVSGGITGSKAFGYDAMGNVRSVTTNGSTLYLSTDYEDRVTRFDFNTGPGQGTVYSTEAYNGMGERLGRVDAAGVAHYPQYNATSPGSALLYDSAGGSVYTPGVAQTVNGRTLYTNVDALGSVHDAQTDGNSTQDAARYDAFGGLVARQGSDALPLGFAASSSYQTDGDTGLMLLGNRYYDPSIGRFMSQDRVHDGTNWYAYCSNNPLSYVDPEGLSADPFTMNGNATQAQVEAQTILNGGLPGETYDVSVNGKTQYSFTLSGINPNNSGWSMGLGIAGDFIGGFGPQDRHYGSSSTQSQQMRQSLGYRQVLQQIAAGKKSGGIKSGRAFLNTIKQFFSNGTQAQLGAFSWHFTNPDNTSAGIDIENALTTNSLFFHIPGAINDNIGNPLYMMGVVGNSNIVPDQTSGDGQLGTINQTIHLSFP